MRLEAGRSTEKPVVGEYRRGKNDAFLGRDIAGTCKVENRVPRRSERFPQGNSSLYLPLFLSSQRTSQSHHHLMMLASVILGGTRARKGSPAKLLMKVFSSVLQHPPNHVVRASPDLWPPSQNPCATNRGHTSACHSLPIRALIDDKHRRRRVWWSWQQAHIESQRILFRCPVLKSEQLPEYPLENKMLSHHSRFKDTERRVAQLKVSVCNNAFMVLFCFGLPLPELSEDIV